jgi:hypothetical protein
MSIFTQQPEYGRPNPKALDFILSRAQREDLPSQPREQGSSEQK